jgi:hypothetical protein
MQYLSYYGARNHGSKNLAGFAMNMTVQMDSAMVMSITVMMATVNHAAT